MTVFKGSACDKPAVCLRWPCGPACAGFIVKGCEDDERNPSWEKASRGQFNGPVPGLSCASRGGDKGGNGVDGDEAENAVGKAVGNTPLPGFTPVLPVLDWLPSGTLRNIFFSKVGLCSGVSEEKAVGGKGVEPRGGMGMADGLRRGRVVGEGSGGVVDATDGVGAMGGIDLPGTSCEAGIACMPFSGEVNGPGCGWMRDMLPERCFDADTPPVGCLVEANFPDCCLILPAPPPLALLA